MELLNGWWYDKFAVVNVSKVLNVSNDDIANVGGTYGCPSNDSGVQKPRQNCQFCFKI